MKKILIAASILLTSSLSFAGEWTNTSFPNSKPIYHTVGTYDSKGDFKLNFSCMETMKENVLITLSGKTLPKEHGFFKFEASNLDTLSTNINGYFKTSEDGVVNLITISDKSYILKSMKELRGVKLTLTSEDDVKVLDYNLSGSSKNLNLFDTKCSFK